MAFFASLRREEERPVEIRFSLVERSKLERGEALSSSNKFLPFASEPELTVDVLVKLAGALDTRNSSLVVVREGRGYRVAGIAFFGWRASFLDPEPTSFPPPWSLTIVARQPGQLAIAHEGSVFARYIDGKIVPVEVTPMHVGQLSALIESRVRQHPGYQQHPDSYQGAYTACLERLLGLAEARGHGGAILWVPGELTAALPAIVDIRRSFLSAPDITAELTGIGAVNAHVHQVLDLAKNPRGPQWRATDALGIGFRGVGHRRLINDHLTLLAQLTRVDGALVIDEYLRPLGFSAVIKMTPEWTGPVENMSSLERGSVDLTKFGTRHRSAVTFAANSPGSIAFVISQDGAIRGMTRIGPKVLFWPDCLGSTALE